MTNTPTLHRRGLACAVLAHIMWGLFPLFWMQLRRFDPLETVNLRVIFAWVFLFCSFPLLRIFNGAAQWQELWVNLRSLKVWAMYAIAACLIFTNWLVFIWAVGQNRILEASLGYYINPLLNVMLGVLIIRERLSGPQWWAVGLAACGVAVMTIAGGVLPWISLLLASTFAVYGLVKKRAHLPPLMGLLFETSVLLLPALLLLFIRIPLSTEPEKDVYAWSLFAMGGVITIMPLSLFAYAAKRVPLSTLGILQYIGPTLQFIIGTCFLTEPFGAARVLGFTLVWLALAIYVYATVISKRPT